MVSPLEVAVINSLSDVNARAMYWGAYERNHGSEQANCRGRYCSKVVGAPQAAKQHGSRNCSLLWAAYLGICL